MPLPQVVVTNRAFPETLALLAKHAEVDANPSVEPWTDEEVQGRSRLATGLLAFMTDRIDRDFFAACPALRVVGAALKGYDNIDVDAATAAGVWVTIVPDLLTVPTAELAIGLMLALSRHIVAGDRSIRAHDFTGWRPQFYGAGLSGATVGIVGLGRVGHAIAERLVPFGCRLLAHDPSVRQPPPALLSHLALTDFATVLAEADFLVLALPLTPATQHLINGQAIVRMKHGARIINSARGSVVDEAAVASALAAGKLAGYAADVFECEDWSRLDRPRVIDPRLRAIGAPTVLTPHLGSAVVDIRREIELTAAHSIVDVLTGRVPRNALNRPTAERMAC
ncbi:MAG: NAD(P)-dependent oxidoreductase [Xanthobacteraceae bacterium]